MDRAPLPPRPRPRAGQPTLAEVIRGAMDARLLDLHTALPGRVKTYDRAKQVADVIPTVRGHYLAGDEPTFEDLPVVPNVPVMWPRGAGYSLQFPLNAGDHVLLVFCESDVSRWRTSGATASPGDLRRHDFSHAFAIPGISPDPSPLDAVGADEAVLDGPTVIRLGGPSAEFVALANLVDQMFTFLATAIAGAATTESAASGLGGMTALNTTLQGQSWPQPTAATKVKAE